MRFAVYRSNVLDPYWNLAAEEWFLDRAAEQEPVLFLWRSRPAVIIGKNQNPWRECDVRWMAAEQVDLARRISGGGAVYHDEGNLNYAFFMQREAYNPDEIYTLVIAALAELGLQASRWNRTSLVIDEQKVSGSAFCLRRNVAMHHGTLLVEAELKRLSRSLKVPDWQIVTKATASVPAPVRNLAEWDPAITVERVIDIFTAKMAIRAPTWIDTEWNRADLGERKAELQSTAWLFDRTPPFEVTIPQKHTTRMAVEEGRIATSNGDSEWIGRPFREWVQQHADSGQSSE